MLEVDGNIIDVLSMAAGVSCIFIRPCRCGTWERTKAIADFLNGVAVVPFGFMMLGTVWTPLMNLVMESPISLGIAGGMGLLFMLAEIATAGQVA